MARDWALQPLILNQSISEYDASASEIVGREQKRIGGDASVS